MSVQKVIDFAQQVLSGDSYYHSHCVVDKCYQLWLDNESIIKVAWLHGAVEDGFTTFKEVFNQGFLNDAEMEALVAITKIGDESRSSYIKACCANNIACAVKLADATINYERNVRCCDWKRAAYYQETIAACLKALSKGE